MKSKQSNISALSNLKQVQFNRILLKISGEVLAGNKPFGINPKSTFSIAKKIKAIHDKNIEIGIVIGGGNIFRGISVSAKGMDRVAADYLGMMATVMNSVALQSELEKLNCNTRVMSALSITQLAEPYIRRRATRHLEKKRIVIFAAGTGNPFFSTDTAASLRASEMGCSKILKATKVNGIYDSDPNLDKNAKLIKNITYSEVISKNLRVMDLTAISLAKESSIPIYITNIFEEDSLIRALKEEGNYSKIH